METITQMKCACNKCLCVVSVDSAIVADGKHYCSNACATGHTDGGKGCGQSGCNCAA